jgi:hypothetical protein
MAMSEDGELLPKAKVLESKVPLGTQRRSERSNDDR